jgi:hypothetical protein
VVAGTFFPYTSWMSSSPSASDASSVDLERLQQELLRTRVARARQLTEDQRLAEAFALTNGVLRRIHEAVMAEMDTADTAVGWREMRRRLMRLRLARLRSVSLPETVPDSSESATR